MQILPLTNDFTQTFTTVLNNQQVTIRIWYQDIGDGWFFSMKFTSGDDIVSGYRINTGSPILKSISSDFIGDIICVPSIEKTAEPGKNNPWNNTHLLIYLLPEESVEAGIETL
ncbi:hypothetical protein KAR91_36145 [Candidatus Pacearchaeota archaeon]|nr:hypothetical protein [Candidatus Pacearchaeota archaeon]